ncbi:MAG: hypothetical protein U1C52_02240 [Patescibacteria group bacterium]|nr:hypothetical protein [Patescibacteria group bacterium]
MFTKNVIVYDFGAQYVDRYLAILEGEMFTMSKNATSPQGVNQYAGQAKKDEIFSFPIIANESLPKAVQQAIQKRIELYV